MNISLRAADWILGLIVLVGSLAVGLYMAHRAKAGRNSSNFFLGGRKILWPMVGASLFATNIGAEHLVGLSGDAYRYGLSAGSVELTTFITLGIASAILFPYYLKNRIYTIPEFLELRYSRGARIFFSGLMLVISIMTKLAFTLFAGALVLNGLLGWNVMVTVIVIGLVVALFTMLGGFTAVAWTDSIQAFIMILGMSIVLFIGLDKAGGWSGLMERVPDALHIGTPVDDPAYPFWGILATAFYAGVFYWGMDQVNVQRVLAAPDLRQARWGAMFATLLKLLPIFIFALPGVIAYALYPGLPAQASKQTFILLINNLLPPGLRGLVLASLLAALITSLIAVLNSVSTLVVRDFVVEYRPEVSEKKQVLIGRLTILAVTFLGFGAAWLVYNNEEGLYKYLQTISAYLVLPVFPAILFGIVSKKVTLKGATASVFAGIFFATLFVIDQFTGPDTAQKIFPFLHYKMTLNFGFRGLWAVLLTTGALFAVSAVTPKTDPSRLEKTTINYAKRWERYAGIKDWRLQWLILACITLGIYFWLF
ncbi:MAG: sodium/solute symporter [Bacteroidales bacterium]|nr:sodium/solute symporter [Bacteroidales bacterium]